MSTEAKAARFKKQVAALEQYRREPAKSKLRPRDLIRIRLRCKLCGRPRAVYRKFGVCRICLRELAHNGYIPGMTKSSW